MVTTIPIIIDDSCVGHPLLRSKYRRALQATPGVSTTTGIQLTPQKLFGYATMKFQDATFPEVATYAVVRKKATNLLDLYGYRLGFEPNHLVFHGQKKDIEPKGQVSELVGIGLGLAAVCNVFEINPNRISRFVTTQNGKRMDYEIVAKGKKFLHEVRGTVSEKESKRQALGVYAKKQAPSSIGYAALSGAISLYNQRPKQDRIMVIDPETLGGEANPNDELAAVLEYYLNVFRLTHSDNGYLNRLRDWVRDQRSGDRVARPYGLTRGEVFTHRVSQSIPGQEEGFRGTLFDLRLTKRSVMMYSTFEAATQAISRPVWFYGVNPTIETLVKGGSWDDLLKYNEDAVDEQDRSILPSGVVVAPAELSSLETQSTASNFATLRARYTRSQQ